MIQIVSELLLLGTSLVVTFEDFRSRTVSVYSLAAFLVSSGFYFVTHLSSLVDVGLNLGYCLTLIAVTVGIVRIVFRYSIKDVLGLGDVLFLVISTPLFRFPSFVIWLNIGLILSLLIHLVLLRASEPYKQKKLIPLAGILSLVFWSGCIIEMYVKPISELIYQP